MPKLLVTYGNTICSKQRIQKSMCFAWTWITLGAKGCYHYYTKNTNMLYVNLFLV